MTTAGLQVVDVRWSVAGAAVLRGVTMSASPGELVAVSGPSGSGKTSLLAVAGGLVEPEGGAAVFGDAPTWTGSGDPRPDVAFILQTYGLVPILTARENVAVAARARGGSPAESATAADVALGRLDVGELGDRLTEELSGGQLQRVAGARALVVRPALLLADEPTSELDERNRENVLAQLRVEAERGAVVVVATHDAEVVALCDRGYHVVDGAVAEPTAAGRHRGPEPVG